MVINSSDIHILVITNSWGNADIPAIISLLEDIASHINRELTPPFTEEICVEKWDKDYPMAHYRLDQSQSHKISLTAEWCSWCQITYQFAHEFCHVLSDHNRLKGCKNKWFHEAICELASVFTLRSMERQWRDRTPFYGKTQYTESLKTYEESHRQKRKKNWENDYGTHSITLSDWLSDQEEEMRDISTRRNTNGDWHKKYRLIYSLVAYALLPIFEEKPKGWNAVRFLPNSDSYIKQYLDDWSEDVKEPDRPFVRLCKERIESTLIPFDI